MLSAQKATVSDKSETEKCLKGRRHKFSKISLTNKTEITPGPEDTSSEKCDTKTDIFQGQVNCHMENKTVETEISLNGHDRQAHW
jgi:hypothetical protein